MSWDTDSVLDDLNNPLRTAMRKCAGRAIGESVTLTDDEVRAILEDTHKSGAEDALAQVNTAAVRNLRAEVEQLRGHLSVLINTVCMEAGSFPVSAPTDEETIKRAIADCRAKERAKVEAEVVALCRQAAKATNIQGSAMATTLRKAIEAGAHR